MHSPPSPSASTPHCPINLDAAYLKVEGFHAEAREGNAAAATAFPSDLKRSDLHLIRRALKHGWAVEPAKLMKVSELVIRARLAGRSNRIIELARQLIVDFPSVFKSAEALSKN